MVTYAASGKQYFSEAALVNARKKHMRLMRIVSQIR